jgi:hypothetical protein
MKRDDLCLAVLAAASIFFLVSFAQLIRRRGPVEMRAPATVISNGHVAQRPLEPYLLFLAEIRRLLPVGASVAVIGPASELGPMDYLVAIGQLPRNIVEPRQDLHKGEREVPRFVAVYVQEFRDDRYRMIAVVPSGHLYEVRR